MPGQNHYLLASLPGLGELGSNPPLTPAQLLERLEGAPARGLVEAVLLADDLLVLLEGLEQLTDYAPAVLTAEQITGKSPLPEPFAAVQEAEGQAPRLAADALWERYYRWGIELARSKGSEFLEAWLRHDLALRNALARARAAALGLDASAYLVAPELGEPAEDVSEAVAAWSSSPDPLAGLKVLDAWRWAWLRRNDRWFTFSDDELAAYAAKLMLLTRWDRLSSAA